jgi:hypothetical protein
MAQMSKPKIGWLLRGSKCKFSFQPEAVDLLEAHASTKTYLTDSD